MIIDEQDDELHHYGTPRHSGRYPWGSHEPGIEDGTNQKNPSYFDVLKDLKSKGLTDKEIYQGMGITSTQYRARRTIALQEKKAADIAFAQRLKDKGTSTSAIARQMGIPEATARSLLVPGAADKAKILTATADNVQKRVDDKGFVDVGLGAETLIGISKEKLAAAVAILQEKGYQLHTIGIPQAGTKQKTNTKVLSKPGTTYGDLARNQDNIVPLTGASEDGGRTYVKIHNPVSINPNRVSVKYGPDGGSESDGIIYVRPGVPDVSIGSAHYAQVRIQVGDGHFLKGMAVYKDDLPKGTDLQFNTSKSDTGNKFDAMKPLKDDKDLPFESIVRQIVEDPGGPNEHVTSVMNIMGSNDGAGIEGGWETWSKTLSSQFLSKQKPELAKAQLGKTLSQHEREFESINSLTNPTVKRSLLEKFADSADSNAVSLDAAALSTRQAWHVILPLNSLKPTEVYAPQYNDGEKVVLIRHPHGGTFELPELTVNNKNPEGRKTLGDVVDAVGIHHSVAQRLSGADFDGDTVIVVPNGSRKITTSPALEGLKKFDPRASYPEYDGMQVIGSDQKQHEMGYISNLITDMTIKGAPHSEVVRAIRHSMVVIDAEKHKLNYKQSFIDNGIADLKRKYQSDPNKPRNRGASTLISRAGSEIHVPDREPRKASKGGPVDTTTGRRVFTETGKTYEKNGKTIVVSTVSKKLAETDDAHTLSSGTPVEKYYADHSNAMKDLANRARLAAINTPRLKYSKSAKKVYSSEVSALNDKLALAVANKPRERQAQVVANAEIKLKRAANPSMTPSERKKIEVTAITNARNRLGASKRESQIQITDDEWDAIQAGAVSDNKLSDILANTDVDRVRELATPKRVHLLTDAKTARAKAMLENGFTRAQVAKVFGVSLSTLDVATKGSSS